MQRSCPSGPHDIAVTRVELDWHIGLGGNVGCAKQRSGTLADVESFFATSGSAAEARAQGGSRPPAVPEWLAPPRDVLGVVVPVDAFLARTPHVVVALPHVTVYPAGMTIHLVVGARRGSWDPQRWDNVRDEAWGPRFARRGRDSADLLVGVEYRDGRRAIADSGCGPLPGPHAPDQPLLQFEGGSGGGDHDHFNQTRSGWLWPLPDGDSLDLVVAWNLFELPETRTAIPLDQIIAAASATRDFWPHDD